MQEFNQWAQGQKDALENWGAPTKEANFHVSDRIIMRSTYVLTPGTAIPTTIEFFKSGSQNNNLSSDTFPLNGKAATIHGIRIEHCIKQTVTAGLENEMQQALEAMSVLSIRYRNRSGVFEAPLSSLVANNNFLDGNDVVSTAKVPQWLLFKNPIQYGATQPIDFVLTVPSGFTTEASTASSTPVLPASAGTNYWVQLQLLTSQVTAI